MATRNFSHITDSELLETFYQQPDNAILGELLQRYTVLLLGVCMKYLKNEEEAKDAVQQVFLKVIHELSKYRVEYFKSWLHMVAKNHCLMLLRDKGRFAGEFNESSANVQDTGPDKEELLKKDSSLNNLHEALQLLNEEQRLCVTLFYLQKQSYQQICLQTGLNTLQVKSYIQNGKRNLKIHLQKMEKNG